MENQNVLAQQLRELGEKNNYKGQAAHFCDITRTILEIVECVPQKPPQWWNSSQDRDIKHGIKYSITLKNPRGAYTFDYWGSIADAEKLELARDVVQRQNFDSPRFFALSDFLEKQTGKKLEKLAMFGVNKSKIIARVKEAIKPSAYDILTCLHPMSEDTFEDWCVLFGYDTDSRTAEKTYNACVEQDRMLRQLFTHAELEAMQEIA